MHQQKIKFSLNRRSAHLVSMNDDLLAIAFGTRAGASVRPGRVPRTAGTFDTWLRAVALGSHGCYAAATTELDGLRRTGSDAVLRSLASSTRASHLRQSGRHALARRYDGVALWFATDAGSDPVTRAAALDALIGLAADSLGVAELDLADRLLARAAAGLALLDEDAAWIWTGRVRLRHLWVRAETALYRGDPATARAHLAARNDLLRDCPSPRHRLKTDLLVAATSAAAGDFAEASLVASGCADTARAYRQLPLEWAATSLLVGIEAGAATGGTDSAADTEARLRADLNARGGAFATR